MKKKSSSVKRKNLKNSIFSPQIKNKRIKKIYQRFEFLIKQKEFKGGPHRGPAQNGPPPGDKEFQGVQNEQIPLAN